MTLGEKIKKARCEKRLTQSALCEDKITRNMLSAIECDKATPSLDTLSFLADALSIPLAYLLSDDDDMFFYRKKECIDEIKNAFSQKKYKECIDLISLLERTDDELAYILAQSHFEIGRQYVLKGSLKTGYENLMLSKDFASKTIYDTSKTEARILIYSALAKNIQSPLLEFDTGYFEEALDSFDFEFYKYLIGDRQYSFRNSIFNNHMKAKELLKSRKYIEAIPILKLIESEKTPETYNSCVMFSVYSDLENCYKQIADFENAYRYASKKMSLIEAFKN